MAKFPIRYSQQAPPQQSGAVRSSVDVRTGEGLAGESLARAGEKLAGFGFEMMAKIQKAEDDVEFSARKREIDSYYSDGYVTAGEVGTPEAQIKIHTEVNKNVQSVSSRNSRVNTALQIYKNNVAAQWGKTYGIQQLNLRKKNIGTQADSNMQSALTNGYLKGYTAAMNTKVSIGLATPAQAKTALEQFENNSVFARAAILADTDPTKAMEMVNGVKVATDDQAERKDNLVGHINGIVNRNNAVNKKAREAEELGLYEHAYIDGKPLTWKKVNEMGPHLSSKYKIDFWNNYKTVQNQKVKKGVSAFEHGNPIVNAMARENIELNPQDVTNEQIVRWVDKGLGANQVSPLLRRLEANKKKQDPLLKRYIGYLKSLRQSGSLGDKDEASTYSTYDILYKNLVTFATSNPTPEQMRVFFNDNVQGDVAKWYHGDDGPPERMPGWKDDPLKTTIEGKEIKIRHGDTTEIGGKKYQAVGRYKSGKIKWIPVK